MRNEIQKELIDAIIPFWEALRDDEYGGFYTTINLFLTADEYYKCRYDRYDNTCTDQVVLAARS